MTLTDFLLARIAEDETVANEVGVSEVLHGRASALDACDFEGEMTGWIDIDPARVLAECETKRQIVRRARRERGRYDEFGDSVGNPIQAVVAWEMAVRLLALPYADHPDYREEWKP
jgi:hypothetical protein